MSEVGATHARADDRRSRLAVVWGLLRDTVSEFRRDTVAPLAAALAFYTIFSMAPIVSIALWVAGSVFGTEAASRALMEQVANLIGPNGTAAIRSVVESAAEAPGPGFSAVLAIGTLALGSTAVFGQLQSALNKIWDVEVRSQSRQRAVMRFATKRLLSFGLVVALGFLLLVSLLASTVLAALRDAVSAAVPTIPLLWQVLDFALSFAVVTLLFMAVYRVLPDAIIGWSDVAVGAIATAALFVLGKLAIGLYLGRATLGSAYGAAGSLVILLVWVYYSAIVCFFGAEFTQVYARCFGSGIRPAEHAIRRGDKQEDLSRPESARDREEA